MSGTGYVPLPAPVTADPGFWRQGIEGLNALRDQQARQAISQIYQRPDVVNQQTGAVDQGRLNALISQSPQAAWNAAPAMLAQGQAQGAQVSARTGQIEQAGKLYNMIGEASGSLVNDPSDANLENIRGSLTAAGAPPGALAELDRIQGLPPDQRRMAAYGHLRTAMGAQYNLAVAGFPAPVQTQMPQGLVTTATTPPSPYAPASTTQVGGVGSTLSPADAAKPTTWTDSRNNPRQGTLGDYLIELQRENVTGPAYDPSGRPLMLPSSGRAGTGAGTGPTSSTAPPPPPANATIRSPGAYTGGGNNPPAQSPPPASNVPAAPSIQQGDPNQPQVVPAPPGSPTSTAPYTGGGVRAAIGAIDAGKPQYTVQPPPVIRAQPIPAGRVSGDVGAMMQGMQLARANPPQQGATAMTAGPGAPTAPAVAATPEPGWGSAPGTYGPGPAAPVARPAAVPQPPTQPAAQPGGSGVVIAPSGAHYIPGPSPGTQQEQEASANQYAADRAEAGSFQARIWPMVQARSILQKNPDLTTGIGAQAVNTVKSGLQTLTSIFTPADIQTIGQAKFDELGKYFQQAVNANPFASGSDQRLASAISGSPNTHLSTLANKEIIDAMIGLERMKLAAFTDFQNSGAPSSEWGNFKAKWQTQHDPRAFVADMLDDAHLKNMLVNMSPSERAAYQNTLALLKANPSILNTAPMPQKQSFLSLPPRPQPNALMMSA